MNIFVLHKKPYKAAKYHCDKHVVKMILEAAQLLCSAHHILGSKFSDKLYRLTHKNHPCSVWVRESDDNYGWCYSYLVGLLNEYTFRYGKIHKTSKLLEYLIFSPKGIPKIGLTDFKLCMPDEYKIGDAVESYRQYYRVGKKDFLKYTKREKPDWL